MSIRYVVDASVLRAAGGREGAPGESKKCREFLMDIFVISHRVVQTAEIKAEWDEHASAFSTKWLSWMVKKGKLYVVPEGVCNDLTDPIESLNCDDAERKMLIKDKHLVEGALATDRRVVSRDRAAAESFARFGAEVEVLGLVTWLDPTFGDRPPGRR